MKRVVVALCLIAGLVLPLNQPSIASAVEPWKITVSSDLTNIDQFENRELKFSLSIDDKSVIAFLNQPGAEIIGAAILAPTVQVSVSDSPYRQSESVRAYACYSPKPKALGGNSGGSALRMSKTGDENRINLQFGCWFPIGMKVQAYTLSIKLSVTLNGSCCSSPIPNSWDNTQVFLFGDYPDAMRPNWFYKDSLNSTTSKNEIRPNVLVQTISEMPPINVIRTAPKTSPEALTFNSKNLIEITEKLTLKYQTTNEIDLKYASSFENVTSSLASLGSRISNLIKQNQQSKYMADLKRLANQIESNQSKNDDLLKLFDSIQPGSSENDVKLKYLYGLDFDVLDKPEVLVAQYPDFKLLAADPTPYLRFIVKSKTAIITTHIGISFPEGGGPWFQGNVILPGNPAFNDQYGGGLVLVENQQWDGSMFLTSLLIGPKYTPLASSDLDLLRKVECSMGFFEDAAGNYSSVWNEPTASTCLPKASQASSAAKDFDVLKEIYDNLARVNDVFQKLRIISEELQNKFSEIDVILTDAELIKKRLDVIDLQLVQERKDLSKLTNTKTTTIICTNGKVTKKIVAVKPKCPSGYKLKK